MRVPSAIGSLVLLAAALGCGGIIDPSQNQVEPVSNTLPVGGSYEHRFSVERTGEFSVRLTALSPDANLFVGFSFGDVLNNQCQYSPFYTNNFAVLNRTALSGRITRGTFCVGICDPGSLTQAQTFTFEVSYP